MWKTLLTETKRWNKGLVLFNKPWYHYIILNARFLWVAIKNGNPYSRAKLRLAFMRYKMTPMYWDRYTVMGKDYANSQFVLGTEYPYYMKQLTWKDKAKALFIPFTIINEEI